mgnify:FL=1
MNVNNRHFGGIQSDNEECFPCNRAERLLWIKAKVKLGYYDSLPVINALAEVILDPNKNRRAGNKSEH